MLKKYVHWEPSCSTLTDRHTDRRTDMTKLLVAFRNFANAPNNRQSQWDVLFRIYRNTKKL